MVRLVPAGGVGTWRGREGRGRQQPRFCGDPGKMLVGGPPLEEAGVRNPQVWGLGAAPAGVSGRACGFPTAPPAGLLWHCSRVSRDSACMRPESAPPRVAFQMRVQVEPIKRTVQLQYFHHAEPPSWIFPSLGASSF